MPLLDASIPEEGTVQPQPQSGPQTRPRHPPTSYKRNPSFPPPSIQVSPIRTVADADTPFMRLSITPSELALEAEAEPSESATSTWSFHPSSATDRSSRISHDSVGRQSFDTFGPRDRDSRDRFSVRVTEHGKSGDLESQGQDGGKAKGKERERDVSGSTVSSTSGSIYHTALDELDRHQPEVTAYKATSASAAPPASSTTSQANKSRDEELEGQDKEGKKDLPGTVFRFDRDRSSRTRLAPSPLPLEDEQPVHLDGSREPGPGQPIGPGILRNPSNASTFTRHRPAASVSYYEPLQDSHASTSISPNKQSPHQFSPSPRQRGRSRSIDSISLHPSISDSVTGLLIPPISTLPLPLVRPGLEHRSTSSILPRELVAKNELDPEQRAILVRRARKLEQILGHSLDERDIERLLIDPITAPRTITTQVTDQAWPGSPSPGSSSRSAKAKEGRRRSLAEWQKEDCVPRLDRNVDIPPTATSGPSHGLARSGSFLARKARAALGMGPGSGGEKKKGRSDLAVYVSREVRVSETLDGRGGVKSKRHTVSTPPGIVMASRREVSTTSSGSPSSPSATIAESSQSDDEATRRTRRLQLAKLHRLLGVPIPPDLVGRHSQDSDTAASPELALDNDQSFMVFDDNLVTPSVNWTTAIKHTLNKVRSRDRDGKRSSSPAPTPPSMSREGSYVDMGSAGTAVMNEKEKAVARKKAQKLEYMFGDAPPQSMFLSRTGTPNGGEGFRNSTPAGQETTRVRQFSAGSYDAYEQSLAGLIYLADNDTATLDTLVDQLEIDPTSPTSPTLAQAQAQTPISPSSPPPGPHTHEARRRRTGKLTHFFGETGIDFDDPPNIADTMERVRSRSNTLSKGDTLDEIMREMWRGVQAEVKRGGMAVKEGERLGEMIDRLRRRRGSTGHWEAL